MRTRHLAPLVVALSISVLVGCAGSDEAGSATGSTTTSAASGPTTTAGGAGAPAARSSAGCGTTPEATLPDATLGDAALAYDLDGTERAYRLAVPGDYEPDEPTPVVLNLHGAGSNAHQQSAYSALPRVGADAGWLVVTPDAVAGFWEMTDSGADDRFLMGLLDEIEAGYCVDLDRVHATGISLGSWKTTVTACAHPDRIASMALIAESVAIDDCDVPVVAFHGTADRVVPYGEGADEGIVVRGGNAALPGVEVNLPAWAANAGCDEEPVRTPIGEHAERWVYDCPDGEGLEFYSIAGGGHTWPGAEVNGEPDVPDRAVDATEIALDWFDQHRLTD
jgi:polyhydroxybutyrate depolymerase